jgi:hypothetical protein
MPVNVSIHERTDNAGWCLLVGTMLAQAEKKISDTGILFFVTYHINKEVTV